ncbi:phage tail sheath C-terminal domain-containing protein, partial [Clostridium neonatale]
FIKRLREDEGKRVQAVLPNYKEADYEGIISVKNGVFIENNIQIDKVKATAYIAALTASASYSTSNTYKSYEGAVDVDTRYTDKEIKEIINDGEIVFVNTIVNNQPKIIIEQDINTFKTFTDDKDKSFKKNRVIRTLDGINNRIKARWEEAYIGNEDNTEDGRNLFKKDILKILETLQSDGAIKSVAIDDIEVLEGESIESVVANVAVQPVDAMEKLYMTVFI